MRVGLFGSVFCLAATAVMVSICSRNICAQSLEPENQETTIERIAAPVRDEVRVRLKGNTYPLARPQYDQGKAPSDLHLERMLLTLTRSRGQEAALRDLLASQQNRTTPYYHRWLSPEEFGNRFGVASSDLAKITEWLKENGFTDITVNHARSVIEFSGTAGQAENAFHTSIHRFVVDGTDHWANVSDPEIPVALAPVVGGLVSLHNFPRHPQLVDLGIFRRSRAGGTYKLIQSANPLFSSSSNDENFYALGPWDFASIYDEASLWNSSTNGSGQTIAIAGQSDINIADAHDFRALFDLPANDPQIIHDGIDPGITADETEADLDTQWAGAVAPGATIDLVVSATTETTNGVDLSAEYIVDNNVAGILSDSYGDCELDLGTAGNLFYGQLWEQAAAEGITVLVASGDQGSAACDVNASIALNGLAVSGLASTPWNVAVGGTDFNQYNSWSQYWSPTNTPITEASALGYIPEMTWNGSCTNVIVLSQSSLGAGKTAEQICNEEGYLQVLGGSGGPSSCTAPGGQSPTSCTGGWPKPTWQSGAGVPADGARDIPDISLFASSGMTDSFYIICQQDRDEEGQSCGLNDLELDFQGVGGTSASAPALAGVMALINQKYGRQGNANYVFYQLASGDSAASIFHDISLGTIAMPCFMGSPNCVISNPPDLYGILSGYNAGTGFDLATGLGSVDVGALVTDWNTASTSASSTSLELNGAQAAVSAVHGSAITATVSVTSQDGTPGGDVCLNAQAPYGSSLLGTLRNGSLTGAVNALPGGSYSVVAYYAGNSQFSPSESNAVPVTITPENSTTQIQMKSYDPWTGAVASIASAPYGTLFIVRSNVAGASGYGVPTGTIVLKDNGLILDNPSYALNSAGNTEDVTTNLLGGQHTITSAYGGDPSFNPSVGSATLTVTPATMYCTMQWNTAVLRPGWSLDLENFASVSTVGGPPPNGTTVAPTGTVSFYSGTTLLAGPLNVTSHGSSIISVVGGIATFQVATAWTSSTIPATAITNYSNPVTAQYSGDGNYAACSSPGLIVSYETGPVPSTLSGGLSTGTANQGAAVSLNLQVAASSPAPVGEPAFPPVTGTIQVVIDGSNSGSPFPLSSSGAASISIDTSSLTLGSHNLLALYSGDANYQPATGGTWILVIDTPSISIGLEPATVTVTNGDMTAPVTVNVQGLNGLSGTISFSCSALPPASACVFTPSSVDTAGSVQLTITTTQASVVTASAHTGANSGGWLAADQAAFGMAGLAVFLVPGRRRKQRLLSMLLVSLILLAGVASCGGGGGSNGGGSTSQPIATTTTLSSSSTTPAKGQSVTITANVAAVGASGAPTPTGSVVFTADQQSSGTTVNLVSGSASWITTFSTAGEHSVSASYAGNSNYLSSASLPLVLNVPYSSGTIPGMYAVTVTASSGSVTASTTLSLMVQ